MLVKKYKIEIIFNDNTKKIFTSEKIKKWSIGITLINIWNEKNKTIHYNINNIKEIIETEWNEEV